eukprot:TRINITY_DN15362_c0_g1_i1.p2 TRINITY_DN15362_c0_g1~~TRINITY_DN15362_c0_g1_i1.p2  ORF type:complete len:414 (-),score=47.64 TRINITY_DN15362_c0_g1_i1:4-1245(-)
MLAKNTREGSGVRRVLASTLLRSKLARNDSSLGVRSVRDSSPVLMRNRHFFSLRCARSAECSSTRSRSVLKVERYNTLSPARVVTPVNSETYPVSSSVSGPSWASIARNAPGHSTSESAGYFCSDFSSITMLHLSFFPEEGAFFSCTETEDELSLVIDEKSLQKYPADSLVLCPGAFRAIEAHEGPETLDETGYVSLLTGVTTRAGLSVLYLSTFSTDLLLVDEHSADLAQRKLKKCLLRMSTGELSRTDLTPKLESLRASLLRSNVDAKTLLTPLPSRVFFASMNRQALPFTAYTLLKLFVGRKSSFCSYTVRRDEVSFIVTEEWYAEFSELESNGYLSIHPSWWRCITMDLAAIGTSAKSAVNVMADILAAQQISMCYLSTFNSDFIIVEDTKVDAAIAKVSEHVLVHSSQ